MKKILFLVSNLLCFILYSQDIRYYRYTLPTISESLYNSLNEYCLEYSHKVKRNETLDKRAKLRVEYFLDVIQCTSAKRGDNFYKITDSIGSSVGHRELFGNPRYFVKPKNDTFPEIFHSFPEEKIKIKGEIMQEIVWSKDFKSQMSKKDISYMVERDIINTYKHSIEFELLDTYKKSKGHDDIIRKWGNDAFGICTMVIVSEKYKGNGYWTYDAVLYNLIVFSKPITTSNNRRSY